MEETGFLIFDGTTWCNTTLGGGATAGHSVQWQAFKDLTKSVVDDVPVHGFAYDVGKGRLLPVEI